MSEIDIYKMTEEIGRYVVEHNTTIRLVAKNFNVSKSIRQKQGRNIRGGESTRQKYLKMLIK